MGRPTTVRQTLPGFARIVQRFWPYIRQQGRLIGASLLALLGEVFFRLLEPWPLKLVFDYIFVTAPARQRPAVPGLDGAEPVALLTLSALAVIVIAGLRAVMAYASTVGFALAGNRVLTQVRHDLYRHLQELSLSYHTKARSGDLTLRVINDIGMLKEVLITAVMPLLANVLILSGMLILMLWLHWKLALLALLMLPLFAFSMLRLSNKIQTVSRKQRAREGAMAATAAETIGVIKTVQALSLEEIFSETFASQNQQDMQEGVKGKRYAASLERGVDVLIAVGTALVLWYGARLVLRTELTPGDLLVFLSYLKNAYKPVRDFAKYTGRLAKATAAGERVLDVLEERPEVYDRPDSIPAASFEGAVCFDEVSFGYELGHPVLNDVSLDVRPGQRVALVGPSGNGKSTLVSLLLRLYDPWWGAVKIDGRDIRRYTLASLRAQIGIVMQDSPLFAASVRDNIAFGALHEVTDDEIEEAARLANAHTFIRRLPDGYDTILGERGVTLSGGERQRVAIARAAIRRAPILILDEPTTGLDEENERAVLDALERLATDRTTFFISHDLHHAARADLIVYLEDGRVQEYGTHRQLMQAAGRYAALFELQARAREFSVRQDGLYALPL